MPAGPLALRTAKHPWLPHAHGWSNPAATWALYTLWKSEAVGIGDLGSAEVIVTVDRSGELEACPRQARLRVRAHACMGPITIPNTHGIRTVSAPSVRVGEHSVLEATTRTLHATKCLSHVYVGCLLFRCDQVSKNTAKTGICPRAISPPRCCPRRKSAVASVSKWVHWYCHSQGGGY